MSFILLRPKLLAVKNSFANRPIASPQNARDSVIFALAISIMYLVYRGTLWAILHINANPNLLYLPPRYPLSMILALLFFMLIISGVAISMGSLFFSQDLDLIMATPISKLKIFSSKLAYITINSCWMPLIFIFPLLLAFGHAYNAGISFYLFSSLVLVPYFLLASSISCLIAILLSKVVPANRSKEMLFLVVVALLVLIYLIIDLVRLGFSSAEDTATISRLVSFLSLANFSFLPSSWAAACMQDFIFGRQLEWPKFLPMLVLSSLTFVSLSHIVFFIFHFDAYTATRNIKAKTSYGNSRTRHIIGLFRGLLKQSERALIEKEILNFSRDVTHIIQLIMLMGLCAIYIFNLRIFLNVNSFPAEARDWWQKFFFVSNSSIAAFVTTGFCTRFVFVSLSLEGKSLWILQSSPLSFKDILNAKFKSWYLPVSILGCFVFCAAGVSLGVNYEVLLLSTVASLSICYGIVGLAIGLGARFANFNWEHSSQLAAGFGNMVFMLTSITLIAANLIPACIMLFINPQCYLPFDSAIYNKLTLIALMFLVIFYTNLAVKNIAINIGAKNMNKTLS
jgi:ABC-2 type transport system permease protein